MAFASAFSRPVSPPFWSAGAAVTPWYLSGGIAAANCIAAYQPKSAASLAESYTNLANVGTYAAAPGTAPAWDATNGWIFAAASSQYLTTGVTPLENWTVIFRYSNQVGSGQFPFGYARTSPSPTTRFAWQTNTTPSYQYGTASVSALTSISTSGVVGIVGPYGWKNAVKDSAAMTYGTNANALPIYIGARNVDSTANGFAGIRIQAFAIYNVTITDAQVLAVTNAMNAL